MDPFTQLELDTKSLIENIEKKQSVFGVFFFIFKDKLFKRVVGTLKRWLFESEVLKARLEKCHEEIKELKTDEKSFVPWKPENKGKEY